MYLKKFNSLRAWKQEIQELVFSFSGDENIIIPGGQTPFFLYQNKELNKSFVNIILSDERITTNIERSNYQQIIKNTKLKIQKLCHFPIHDYRDIDLDETSLRISKLKQPLVAVLGLGDDGHYASIFENSREVKSDSKNILKIVKIKYGDLKEFRVSLSENFISKCSTLIFIFKGREKKKIFEKIENNCKSLRNMPIGKLIESYSGNLKIMYCVND